MKKMCFVTVCFLFFAGMAFAQKADTARQNEYLGLYRRALAYNDLGSAAYAVGAYLYNGGNAAFNDTLALIYYNMNNLGGAYRIAGEINEKDPKNATALTLLADISGRAGEVKTSLEWYEKLIAVAPSAFNQYQLATKQFILERNLECRQSLQKVIADSAEAKEQKVRLDIGEGYAEEVPVLAAAMNMMGALAYKEKDNAKAKEWYEKAVAIFPDFVIAKQNLEELKKGAEQAKPATPAKPAPKKT
jgi:tetratricopeptide (TPR) repeat protein